VTSSWSFSLQLLQRCTVQETLDLFLFRGNSDYANVPDVLCYT